MQEPGAEALPGAEEVSEVLREILAGPEFATLPENPIASFMDWVLGKVVDLWFWLRELLGERAGLAEIVTLLIVAAVVVIAVVLTRRYAPEWLGKSDGEGLDAVRETPTTARQWLRLATERAGRGDLRPAATALYQGFLLTLDRREILSFHSSKTPGDYATELGHGGGGAVAGARFLDSFQDFSFGPERPTSEGYEGLARLAREAGCSTELVTDESGDGGEDGGGRVTGWETAGEESGGTEGESR